jgi:hypothetical protein
MSPEKPKQHHCEIVTGAIGIGNPEHESILARKVEAAYQKLNDQALADNMVILVTTQTTEAFTFSDGETPGLAVIVTAQRILRTDLEDAQRRAMLMGAHAPQVGRG